MTTEALPARPAAHTSLLSATSLLLSAVWWSLAVAVTAMGLALLAGVDAFTGALTGGLATLAVLAIGTWAVFKVATAAPMASLIAALVVFTAQGGLLLAMLAVTAKLTSGHQVQAAALAVIALTMAWTTAFLVRYRTVRILLFEAPSPQEATPVGATDRVGVN
jgi:hypothetical protein